MSGDRLKSVDAVRTFQRQWLQTTRENVEAGKPFVICNGDEAEEICAHFGVPVLVINYWNSLIAIQQKAGHFREVLHDRGYPGNHFFALGYASSLDPEPAPWGGIPKPSLILGSGRWESEMRICELWAEHYGCDYLPLDFNMSPPFFRIPERWWEMTRDRWEELVDHRRLAERKAQELGLIRKLEQMTGNSFDSDKFNHSMNLLNQQMDEWQRAQNVIAETRPNPVSVRDQMSMYQAMWHRGTEQGLELVRNYRVEVEERARAGKSGSSHPERLRLYYNSQTAPWGSSMEEKYGATLVSCSYTGIPSLYARNVKKGDGLEALAARHLFLFHFTGHWMIRNATDHQCDAIISHEAQVTETPSIEARLCEAQGIPYLAIPGRATPQEETDMVDDFLSNLCQPAVSA